jgi:hypothetical protein
MELLQFLDDAFLARLSYPIPELLRESLQRAIAFAQQDLSSDATSVHWPRDDDPLSVCTPSNFYS